MLAALFLLALADDVDLRIKEFTEAMKAAKSDDDRIAAVQALGKARHLKAAQKLAQVVGGPYPDAVKVAACDAIGRIGDPKAGPALQNVLNAYTAVVASDNPKQAGEQEVAKAIIRALGAIRDRSAVPKLVPILTKNNIPVIAETVRALGRIRDPACLDQLVRLHYAAMSPELGGAVNPRKPLAPDTLAALRRITGQKSLTSADDWTGWWRSNKGFAPPPEESLGGLFDVDTWALVSKKEELNLLGEVDLVLLDPALVTKDQLAGVKAIALSGDPKAALDKGFTGFVVAPEQAADMRKKFPRALLVSRDPRAAPHVNAILAEGLDPRKADAPLVEALKDARTRHNAAVLALFRKEDAQPAARFAKDQGFLPSVSRE